jgi:hypothetical protein
MITSRFQLGLIATLAVGLGFSLASSQAVGYPAGGTVSLGSNPVWSIGGDMGSGSHTVVTAADGDLIITDISLSSTLSGYYHMKFQLSDGTGLAYFSGENPNTRPLNRTFSSGLRIPEGDSLTLDWEGSYGGHSEYRYTFSGYYAHP